MAYWESLDKLISESKIIIDRPQYSSHPKFSNIVYPYNYGYLEQTISGDGEGIDIWLKDDSQKVSGTINTVDLFKKDAEVKLLIGFDLKEMLEIEKFHNIHKQRAILVVRRNRSEDTIPFR